MMQDVTSTVHQMNDEDVVSESDNDWVHSSAHSVTSTSSLPLTRNMQDLSIEKEWDLLSNTTTSNDDSSSEQANNVPRDTLNLSMLEDWRHVTSSKAAAAAAAATTPSEAGMSEISIVSSNAFDPIYFPFLHQRSATPTNRAPQRGCSTRHGVLCQLCSEEIRGMRWMCKECPQWSVCSDCFVITAEHEVHPVHTFIRVFSPTDIFTIPVQPGGGGGGDRTPGLFGMTKVRDIIDQPTIHLDVECHNCKGSIIGHRYDCADVTCQSLNISFCQDCEALPINCHPPAHPLIKYKLSKESSRLPFGEHQNVPTNSSNPVRMQTTDYHSPQAIKRHFELSKATVPTLEDFSTKRIKGGITTSERITWMMEMQKQDKSHTSQFTWKKHNFPNEDIEDEEIFTPSLDKRPNPFQTEDSEDHLLEHFFDIKTSKQRVE